MYDVIEFSISGTKIDKNTSNNDLTDEQISALYEPIKDLANILKNKEYKPQIVKDGRKEDVVPLDLVKYDGINIKNLL